MAQEVERHILHLELQRHKKLLVQDMQKTAITGYELSIGADAMYAIDVTALRQHLTQQQDPLWDQSNACVHRMRQKAARKPIRRHMQMNDPAGTDLERRFERIIQQTLAGVIQTAMHPRTAISVILQVLEHDGNLLACAPNAASTALTDAAVPMTSIIVSAVAPQDKEGTVRLTLLVRREEAAGATGTFAFTAQAETPGAEQLTVAEDCLASLMRGPTTTEGFLQMLSVAHKGAQRAATFSRMSLTRAHDFL